MSAHAVFSPSSAHRWIACPGSIRMERGLPDTSSAHADEGTAAHFLAADCLENARNAGEHLGRVVGITSSGARWEDLSDTVAPRRFTVDDDMAEAVQVYVDAVRQYATGGALLVEQRLDFGDYIGVPDQFGTSDAVVVADNGDELQAHDLKFGRGVKVDADHNEQLMLYALGALDMVALMGYAPKRVRLVIHQPRLQHLSEWDCTVEDLLAFAEKAKAAVNAADSATLNPTEKGCRWCKAKATCPALRDQVQAATLADFDKGVEPTTPTDTTPPAALAGGMAMVGLVEDWCKAVRAETERRLLAGQPVDGWKLVEGRRGARKWSNEAEAEAALKAMRVKHDQMYDYSVISPTSAEKLAKAEVIGPRQWPKLASLIVQSEGKPSVAPASDKRPAFTVTPTADDFADETGADLV